MMKFLAPSYRLLLYTKYSFDENSVLTGLVSENASEFKSYAEKRCTNDPFLVISILFKSAWGCFFWLISREDMTLLHANNKRVDLTAHTRSQIITYVILSLLGMVAHRFR